MADQISNIKFKRQVLQLKPPSLCLQTLMVGLWVLAACICSIQTANCPSSVPSSAATSTEQCTFDFYFGNSEYRFILSSILCSFSEYSKTYTDGVAAGPVSNSLYYLYLLQPEKNRNDLNLAKCIFNVLKIKEL